MRPLSDRSKSFHDLSHFLAIPIAVEGRFTGVTSNTRYIEPGDLFIAIAGEKSHGASFAAVAAEKGAVAILTDEIGANLVGGVLPTIVVSNPKEVSADIASWFFDRPFSQMVSVGVTGTNGKTTVATLLRQLWQKQNREAGMIGTTGVVIGDDLYPTTFTTPEGSELQAIAATMVTPAIRKNIDSQDMISLVTSCRQSAKEHDGRTMADAVEYLIDRQIVAAKDAFLVLSPDEREDLDSRLRT